MPKLTAISSHKTGIGAVLVIPCLLLGGDRSFYLFWHSSAVSNGTVAGIAKTRRPYQSNYPLGFALAKNPSGIAGGFGIRHSGGVTSRTASQ